MLTQGGELGGGGGGGGNNNYAQEETDLGDTWFGMSSVEWRLLRL